MSEQKINVKSTYVATVKKDVANDALSFYANKKENNIVSDNNIFPDVVVSTPEVSVPEPVVSEEVTNTVVPEPVVAPAPEPIVLPKELKIEDNVPVEEPTPVVETPSQPVNSEELPGIPNLNILNTIPEEPAPVVSEPVSSPVVEPVVAPAPEPMPSVPPVATPNPIPNPVPEPVIPTPVNDNFTNIENMVNQVNQQVNENPIRFDASHETNLLGALNENTSQPNIGSIPVTPENLNVVREFGVDEPIVTDTTGTPVNKPAMGFVNSKILLVLVIIFFLASCVFLGYEIYKYVTLPK